MTNKINIFDAMTKEIRIEIPPTSFSEKLSDTGNKNSNNKMWNNSDFNCNHTKNVHRATAAEDNL
jgi:hypothetical protein